MIVKNEEAIIGRCLEAVRPHIDTWVIVDTGSTDNTKREIAKALEGIPGELHDMAWEGFGACRTRALRLAEGKADYALVVDADEILEAPNGICLGDDAAYTVWAHPSAMARFITRRIFNLRLSWSYVGVLHEYPTASTPWDDKHLDGVRITTKQDGARTKAPDKHLNDAKLLERALLDDPNNSRYVYYLAQSLRDAGEYERAASQYLRRAALGPGLNPEEIYCSYLEAGRAFGRLGRIEECEKALMDARRAAPTRPEAMASLATLYEAWIRAIPPHGTMNVETYHYQEDDDAGARAV